MSLALSPWGNTSNWGSNSILGVILQLAFQFGIVLLLLVVSVTIRNTIDTLHSKTATTPYGLLEIRNVPTETSV